MSVIITVIIFFVVLGVLVCVHELGHFLAAKFFKVEVDEFGFGFPPRLIGKKFKGTLYSINWIPLGGFVKIKGVAGDDKDAASNKQKIDPSSFQSKSFLAKFIILFAGIGMNIILAAVIFTLVFTVGYTANVQNIRDGAVIKEQAVLVSGVVTDSPADQVGILPGDNIIKFEDVQINTIEDVQNISQVRESEVSLVQIEREGQILEFSVVPVSITHGEEVYIGIGVALQELGTIRYPWYLAGWYGVKMTGSIIVEIVFTLVQIVKDVFRTGQVGEAVAGPIGIAVITGQAAQLGFTHLLQFSALLSINLAIFNFLPLPALDGGRIVFVVIEKLRRQPINQKVEAIVHNVGFMLLLILVLLVTIQDASRYNIFSFLTG